MIQVFGGFACSFVYYRIFLSFEFFVHMKDGANEL